jgi:hypothetical protein
MEFREEYGVDRFGKYELILGLVIDLFEGWKHQELVSDGYLDKIKSIGILRKSGRKVENSLFEGTKGKRRILYLNLSYSASRASSLWEPYFCHGFTDRAVALGWCGDLTGQLEIGSLVIPTQVIAGEGMSTYYFSDGKIPPRLKRGYVAKSSKRMMTDIGDYLQKSGLESFAGKTYSIESFNCETKGLIKQLHKDGFCGIDLETSAFLSAAKFHGKDAVVVLAVSDKPYRSFHNYIFPRNEIPKYFFDRVKDVVKLSTSFLINS